MEQPSAPNDALRPGSRLVEDERISPREQQPGTTTLHLNPAADFHPYVLLPGDPARAMAIAIAQLKEPRMFNHRRGLWGYSGLLPNGEGLLVQSTGMGGPSAAIICEELIELGAEVLIRVGTCGAIDPSIELGQLVVVERTIADDGAGALLTAGEPISGDADIAALLLDCAEGTDAKVNLVTNATVDLFYDPDSDDRHAKLRKDLASTIEMECSAVFGVAARHGVRAACLLAVTDQLSNDSRQRLSHDEITQLGELLGEVGAAAMLELTQP